MKTDQIIDDVGDSLHVILDKIDRCDKDFGFNLLLRKGAAYLIYSDCEVLTQKSVIKEINKLAERITADWGLRSQLLKLDFAQGKSMEAAVYQLLDAT